MAIKLKADTAKPEGRAAWSTRVSGGNVAHHVQNGIELHRFGFM
jgi:hypothetical protein